MLELKEYQRGALDALTRWLETLEDTQRELETMVEMFRQAPTNLPIPDELRNYPKAAWQKLKENGGFAATAGEYVNRTDDANRPIPHICFKVPTGGGKTLLAAASLEHLPWQRGLMLWIVPSKAIYAQTKAALWDKQHPYRKMLNRASAGRVKMLEKEDTLVEIYDRRSYLAHVLREHVKNEVEKQAEQVFRRKLDQDEIRFDLETREPNYRMVDSYEIQVYSNDRQLERYGEPVQLSLFEKVFDQQFDSDLERNFAYYLDEERALQWWHRVAARQRGEYYLQGWKRGRIYPDFVAITNEILGVTRVLIFDTKGEHLAGNLDTEYKRKVLETLEGHSTPPVEW